MTGMKDRNGKRWSAWKRRTAAGLLAVLTALSGCGRTNLEAQEEENSFFAMNTYMTFTAYGEQAEPSRMRESGWRRRKRCGP